MLNLEVNQYKQNTNLQKNRRKCLLGLKKEPSLKIYQKTRLGVGREECIKGKGIVLRKVNTDHFRIWSGKDTCSNF